VRGTCIQNFRSIAPAVKKHAMLLQVVHDDRCCGGELTKQNSKANMANPEDIF
jgi:hypothetical protein